MSSIYRCICFDLRAIHKQNVTCYQIELYTNLSTQFQQFLKRFLVLPPEFRNGFMVGFEPFHQPDKTHNFLIFFPAKISYALPAGVIVTQPLTLGVTALFVIPRHDVPRNPSTSFGVPYRRDPFKRDVAPTMNDPVNVIMTRPR